MVIYNVWLNSSDNRTISRHIARYCSKHFNIIRASSEIVEFMYKMICKAPSKPFDHLPKLNGIDVITTNCSQYHPNYSFPLHRVIHKCEHLSVQPWHQPVYTGWILIEEL